MFDALKKGVVHEYDEPDRLTVIRDLALFQVKLLVDGIRDLVLVPLSLVAAAISLLTSGRKPGQEFYKVLRAGRRSEHWINLFSAADRVYGPETDKDGVAGTDLDRFAAQVEAFVVEEYKNGGVTKNARDRIDRAIEKLQRARRAGP